jgi:hypothetical protein
MSSVIVRHSGNTVAIPMTNPTIHFMSAFVSPLSNIVYLLLNSIIKAPEVFSDAL